MAEENSRPTGRERLAVYLADRLHRVGLGGVVRNRLVRGLANGLLPRNARTREIAAGLGRGLKLRVLPGTPRAYWMGTHEPAMQAVIRDEVRPGMVVYECGANIGYFAVIFARLVGLAGRVFAFEPSPGSWDSLAQAPLLNGFDHLACVRRALWHRSETLRFVQGGADASPVLDHVAGSFAEAPAEETPLEVPAVSLDEFVYDQGHPPPDFLKIDVEGAEGKVLAGARRLLAERRPRLLLEIHGAPGREVWSILQDHRYAVRNIATGQVPRTVDDFAVWVTQYLATPGAER